MKSAGRGGGGKVGKQGEEGERISITKLAATLRIKQRPPIIFITSRNQTLQVILPV